MQLQHMKWVLTTVPLPGTDANVEISLPGWLVRAKEGSDIPVLLWFVGIMGRQVSRHQAGSDIMGCLVQTENGTAIDLTGCRRPLCFPPSAAAGTAASAQQQKAPKMLARFNTSSWVKTRTSRPDDTKTSLDRTAKLHKLNWREDWCCHHFQLGCPPKPLPW